MAGVGRSGCRRSVSMASSAVAIRQIVRDESGGIN